MRLAGIAKGGYYPTPKRCVELLAELISVYTPDHSMKQETLRIIDPCCGPGDACETLASKLSTKTKAGIRTYGVELEKNRSETAREQMDFALSSDIFQTTIANNSFHLLYLNPPYDFDQESKRVEHAFLLHCTKYLVDGGLLVFVVPRHRLAGSARYLAGNYNRLVCRRFPDPEYDDFDQVMLLGRRKSKPEQDPVYEEKIRRWSEGPLEAVKTLEDPPGSIPPEERAPIYVPTGERTELLFTIRSVDPVRAAEEAQRSGLWTDQSIRESLWPTENRKTQPLMPLRQGHMAMLVVAGFLDNLTLEANGKRVLVKGRTTKKMELVEETPDEETWRDRMHTTIRMLDLDTGEIQDVETRVRAKQPVENRDQDEEYDDEEYDDDEEYEDESLNPPGAR